MIFKPSNTKNKVSDGDNHESTTKFHGDGSSSRFFDHKPLLTALAVLMMIVTLVVESISSFHDDSNFGFSMFLNPQNLNPNYSPKPKNRNP